MPPFIAANACSSGTGVAVQVILIRPCYEQSESREYGGEDAVNEIG